MPSNKKDEAREYRISMEIIVDAYGVEEQAMGWYYYLADKISFPFRARCIKTLNKSYLCEGEEYIVKQMAPLEECLHEMFVEISWNDREVYVPLFQLQSLDVDKDTQEAIADWHYWMAQGYKL